MTPDQLSALAGALLSLLLSYTPGLARAFAALAPVEKRLVLAGCLLAVAAGALGLACGPRAALLPAGLVQCSEPGLSQLLTATLAALVANQSTYLLSPKRARPQEDLFPF